MAAPATSWPAAAPVAAGEEAPEAGPEAADEAGSLGALTGLLGIGRVEFQRPAEGVKRAPVPVEAMNLCTGVDDGEGEGVGVGVGVGVLL